MPTIGTFFLQVLQLCNKKREVSENAQFIKASADNPEIAHVNMYVSLPFTGSKVFADTILEQNCFIPEKI